PTLHAAGLRRDPITCRFDQLEEELIVSGHRGWGIDEGVDQRRAILVLRHALALPRERASVLPQDVPGEAVHPRSQRNLADLGELWELAQDLVGEVAHDLRDPIGVTDGFHHHRFLARNRLADDILARRSDRRPDLFVRVSRSPTHRYLRGSTHNHGEDRRRTVSPFFANGIGLFGVAPLPLRYAGLMFTLIAAYSSATQPAAH